MDVRWADVEYSKEKQAEIQHCLNCKLPAYMCTGKCDYIVQYAANEKKTFKIKDLNTGIVYDTAKDAAKALNRCVSLIRKASSSETRTVDGHRLIRVY